MKAILNTGRTTGQGIALELGKRSQSYFDETAIVSIGEEDMDNLSLAENSPVKLSTEFGSVVVKCKKDDLDRGRVFMPLGPWSNAIIGPDTEGSGLPRYKNLVIDVSKTSDDLTTLESIIMNISGKRIPRAFAEISTSPPITETKPAEAKSTNVKDIICPFCGCLCDDLEFVVQGERIIDSEASCALARSKFFNYHEDRAKPMIKKNGELVEVTLEETLDRAAEIMKKADSPLIYGLSSTEVDAQRLAVELAELTGASIDNTSSVCHGPTIIAAQDTGVAKFTLGEIRNRADLVIYWGCNPAEAHVRHATRYSATPEGMFREKGRKDRVVIHVDVRETRTGKVEPRWCNVYQISDIIKKVKPGSRWCYVYQIADVFLKVNPGQDYELLSALRASLKGHDVGDVAGLPSERIKDLAEKMKSCKFGVIFFGLGLTSSGSKHMNVDAALRLVRDLNDYTKFTILPMRGHYNVTGADEVMLWSTGYPFAVNFSRGYPTYNPGEFTAVDMLTRKECDAALIISSDPVAHFPAAASKHLAEIPTIVLDPKVNLTSLVAEVLIPSAIAGIEADGTAYRMDGVPIRLRKLVNSKFLPDREILEKIVGRVKSWA